MAIYKKSVGWGAYTPKKLYETIKNGPQAQVDGQWIPARPEPYWSFKERLRQAWDVLTYRADALYWKE